MKITGSKKLQREVNEIPEYIEKAILENNLEELFKARPAYQQNDYISWIKRAVREETKQKRLSVMISELKSGDSYMNMKWHQKS